MNRRPILGLMLTILLMPMHATRTAGATPQVSTQGANSQPKPNDAVVHDFVFGDGENLASLKLHYLAEGFALDIPFWLHQGCRRRSSERYVPGI
jgi:hypothetical protein